MNRHVEPEYRRYTAVLREDNRNYAITPTRRPRGKAVIEIHGTKGLLNCSVKNLAPQGTGIRYPYVVRLVSDDEGKVVPVQAGLIKISEEGLGESNWTFDVGNVKNTGLDIDSFVTIEVRVNTLNKNIPGDRVLVGQLELEEALLPEEPKMEKVSPFGQGLPLYQWWKFYPGIFQDWLYHPTVSEKLPPRKLPAPTPDNSSQTYGGLINSTEPISYSCLGKLGEAQSGPVFQGHQLIGLQYDARGNVKYLVHGIPGRFCLRDQPYGGVTGYTYWHPLPGQRYKAGQYGYWLIHIDPITGEVVFPQKATDPPDCDHCNKKEKD